MTYVRRITTAIDYCARKYVPVIDEAFMFEGKYVPVFRPYVVFCSRLCLTERPQGLSTLLGREVGLPVEGVVCIVDRLLRENACRYSESACRYYSNYEFFIRKALSARLRVGWSDIAKYYANVVRACYQNMARAFPWAVKVTKDFVKILEEFLMCQLAGYYFFFPDLRLMFRGYYWSRKLHYVLGDASTVYDFLLKPYGELSVFYINHDYTIGKEVELIDEAMRYASPGFKRAFGKDT